MPSKLNPESVLPDPSPELATSKFVTLNPKTLNPSDHRWDVDKNHTECYEIHPFVQVQKLGIVIRS